MGIIDTKERTTGRVRRTVTLLGIAIVAVLGPMAAAASAGPPPDVPPTLPIGTDWVFGGVVSPLTPPATTVPPASIPDRPRIPDVVIDPIMLPDWPLPPPPSSVPADPGSGPGSGTSPLPPCEHWPDGMPDHGGPCPGDDDATVPDDTVPVETVPDRADTDDTGGTTVTVPPGSSTTLPGDRERPDGVADEVEAATETAASDVDRPETKRSTAKAPGRLAMTGGGTVLALVGGGVLLAGSILAVSAAMARRRPAEDG